MTSRDSIRQYFTCPDRRDLEVEEAIAYICFALLRGDLTQEAMIDNIERGGKYVLPTWVFKDAIVYLIETEGLVYRQYPSERCNFFQYGAYDRGVPLFLEFGDLWYNREYRALYTAPSVN